MNRRSFLTTAAAALAATALPAQAPMTIDDAQRRAESLWGSCACVDLTTGTPAIAANRPNGEYAIGWYDEKGRSQTWYGDSWEDAFATHASMPFPLDSATGKRIIPDPPGPNS